MTTKFGEDAEVELELCLSLGGPFKKSEKCNHVNGHSNVDVNLDEEYKKLDTRRKGTRKMPEVKQSLRNGEGECKRIRIDSNGVTKGVMNLDLSFSKMGDQYGWGLSRETGSIGSPICSSSDITDPCSSSHQEGISYNVGTNSGITKEVNNIGNDTDESMQKTNGSIDPVVVETQELPNSIAKGMTKPPKPHSNGDVNGNNGSVLPFTQMPCVTSTGPEGKTVNGFLYRYSKSEISIICVCHGTSFSPAEFILHAGGTHVSHPLRHITVIPSTF